MVRPTIVHKGEPSSSPPSEPIENRQRIEKGESSKVELYSPSQTPLRLDDEKIVRRELK